MITVRHMVVWGAAFLLTLFISVFWHVALFEQAYLELGVYTRMDNPIYGFGFLAWIMESTAFVAIFLSSKWGQQGILGGLKLALFMAMFTAAASVVGSAAKIEIADLPHWFLLSGGFLVVHFGVMGAAIGELNKRLLAKNQ